MKIYNCRITISFDGSDTTFCYKFLANSKKYIGRLARGVLFENGWNPKDLHEDNITLEVEMGVGLIKYWGQAKSLY